MISQPLNRSWVYKVLAIALCITLTAMSVPPRGWALLFGVGVAHAAPAQAPLASMLPGAANSPMAQALQEALPPELADQLTGMGALGPDGQPNGMLMDVDAMQAMAQKEPATLAAPISISRVQSAYAASDAISGTLVVTFTVTNNQPPTVAPPQLPPSATITDTIDAVASIDFSQDPNVIHNVLVADSLTGHATFVSSSPMPDSLGDQYAWNLGDIPPLGSITASLVLKVPTTAADFVELDAGASAWGTLQGRAVSASTTPAVLTPDDFGDWLMWTVDADYYDEYAVAKAAELGNDWAQAFAYIRSLGYESYKGSLRGTRGTLWSEAGNSLDQASLLIAMLRGSGVPARYRHGTLSTARAQELISSMFPETPATTGYIPPDIDVATPAEDPTLLDETRDHWWVEAYVNGAWTDLDPCFASAEVGDTFYSNLATDGTDQIAEVPDTLRHKVTFTVKTEKYHPLNPGHSGLDYGYPLSHTFNAVELVGNPVTLQHLVQTDSGTGYVFYYVQRSYTPYLVVGDQTHVIEGSPFQDSISNFPFGTFLVTAEWLIIELHDPNGQVETHVREITDSVGFERRQTGGTITVEQAGEPAPVVSQESYYTVLVSPSRVPASVMDAHYQQMALAAVQGQGAFATLETLGQSDEITSEDLPELRQARHAYGEVARVSQRLHLLLFASMSDYGADWLQDSFLVKPYAASPRLYIASWERDQANDTNQMRFDMRKDDVRTVLYPGQTWQGLIAFNYARGMLQSSLESALMEQLTGEQAISVASVFREASLQGIHLEKVSAVNLALLDRLEISDEAKARITEALEQHQCFVIVPERSVTVGGQTTVGWFLIDIINGHTVDVMENGQHQSLVEYDMLFQGSHYECLMALIGFFHGYAAYGIAFLAKLMAKMPFNDIDRKQAYSEAFQEASDVIDQVGQALTDAWSALEDCSFVDNDTIGSMAGAVDAYVDGVGFSASFSIKLSVTLFETPGFVDCLNSLGAELPTGTYEHTFVEVKFEFKLGGLKNGAALAQVKIASWLDPPLPKSLLAHAIPSRRAPAHAQGTLAAAQSLPGNELYASLTSNASQVKGTLTAQWVAGGHTALEFTQLTASTTAVYAPDGVLIGAGSVQVYPLQSTAMATVADLPISYVLTGEGASSFYAPALPGLGAGSNWQSGTVQLDSGQPYTLTVYNALAVLDGSNVYSGTFSLVVQGVMGAASAQIVGHTTVPNLATLAYIQTQSAELTLGPATGILTLDGAPLEASNGLALTDYTGLMTVTQSTSTADQIELNGTASLFGLVVSPTFVMVAPHTPVSVQASILSNLTDNYTITIEGPLDWTLTVDNAGQITALSPLGTAPNDYGFRVTAQSRTYPNMVLSAFYTIRTTAYQGMQLLVRPDPTYTVPAGPFAPGADPDSINNGQVQVPGAAYTVDITNTSTTSHTFSISSLSLPSDWLIVSGSEGQTTTTLTLPAGGVGQVGLYVSPTLATLLPPGTSYPFTVTATMGEAPSLSLQQGAVFVMPAIAFNYLEASPTLVYASPDISATFDLALTNVGNAAGTFDVDVTLPITTWVGAAPYSAALAAGESDERAVVFTPTNAALGSGGAIVISSPASGTAYTQTECVAVRITGPCVVRNQNAVRSAAQLDDTQLVALLQNLTLQLGRWELDEANFTLQARVVAALNNVIAHLHAHYPRIDTGDLEALAAAPSVAGFCAPASALQDDLTTIAQRHVTAAFSPGLAATLLGQAVPYTLTLRNRGTLTTTYAVTLTGLPAGWASWTNRNVNLTPGSAANLPLVITPTVFSYRSFGAHVQAVEDDFIQAQAAAGLNAVDAFVRIVAVTPTPSFVETGVSSTTLSIQVANVARIYQQANARAQIIASGGIQAWADDVPLAIRTGAAATYTLATVDTSGWAEGVYTVSVELLDGTGAVIPDGSAYAYLGVGQALQLSQAVEPAVVPPGTVTVTTYITSRIRQTGVMSEAMGVRAALLAPVPPAQAGVEYGDAARRTGQAMAARFGQTNRQVGLLAPAAPQSLEATPGVYRLENGDPSLIYAGSWATNTSANRASAGTVARTRAAGNTVTTSFSGAWVGVGLATYTDCGFAEIFIDGVSKGVIDTYSHARNVTSYYYALISGTHTITVSVLPSKNDFSSDYYVNLDYIDVWDGTAQPYGTFEQDDPRVYRSNGWDTASSGVYLYDNDAESNAWFPFTGDSLTYHAIASTVGDKVELRIDGISQGYFDLYNLTLITRTYAFSLTSGPHVFQVSAYRGQATIDAFTVPGAPPYYEPPVRTGVIRCEEDDPALRYNGVPLIQTATDWAIGGFAQASRGYAAWSHTPGNTVSLTFTGTWVSVGFATANNNGHAGVSIDGVDYEPVDTYSSSKSVHSVYYGGLSPTTHTITITVLDSKNDLASDYYVRLDYIDTWDGAEMPLGRSEAIWGLDPCVSLSADWTPVSNTKASGGVYVENGSNAWFLFTGDSVAYLVFTRQSSNGAEVWIDGVSHGIADPLYPFTESPVALQYTGLGAGPHVLRIANQTDAWVDAFEAPPAFVGIPMVEWYDTTPAGGPDGMVTTPAVGDLDGDGIVEVVASSSNGNLYVYRGDGGTGGGSPLLWQHVITGSDPDAPALADLDGAAGAEIVVGSQGGLYAFHANRTLLWQNASISPDWGGTAIGNLDDDGAPEIVVAADDGPYGGGVYVVEADGSIAWGYDLDGAPSPPLLADLTGDGKLDILVAQDSTLYLFDYARSLTPTLEWQLTFTTSLEGRGAPSVADIDGLQPGGDPGPEIAIVSNGYIHVVDADGVLLWSYDAHRSGEPGGVSIADTDGDGEVEIVASMQVPNTGYTTGRIYVLNADHSLLWDAMAQDSTSANSVSTHDFNGDGDWEVVWNGLQQGLTIYRGSDGAILFNESIIKSNTAMDYPIVADVDGDGHAEIVAVSISGIYVVGHDAAWAPSRPLWNQYNYHVTNVADDLSVPPDEPDSWALHNTYRTQTPLENPTPAYWINLTHTVPLIGLMVLTDTFSPLPDTETPPYHWAYRQYWYEPPHVTSFAARLPDMRAGEVRQVSTGSEVTYRLPSGGNRLTLPPLYVEAAHIVAVTPPTITVNPGSTARYAVSLYNPTPAAQTYTLSVSGLPGDFAAPASVVLVPANATLAHALLVSTPPTGELGPYSLAIYVQTDAGGTDAASANLVLADILGLSVEPSLASTPYGGVVTYTLTLTNDDDVAHPFTLSATGLEAAQFALPASLSLEAHETLTATLVVTAYQPLGIYPFQVQAETTLADSTLSASDGAVLSVLSEPGVDIRLAPSTATAGQASPAFFAVVVTNTGSLADSYELSASLPTGWSYEFRANGDPLAQLDLTPYVFNAASLQLVVTPPDGVSAASYPISVTAASSLNVGVSASDDGLVDVSPRGVTVEIAPHSVTMDPLGSQAWDVLVTNTGEQADTFDLVGGGIVSSTAQFDANPISLGAGQSSVVHLGASDLHFALVETHPFAVTAYSQNDPEVLGYDVAELSFLGYEAVSLSITPTLIVFTDTLTASYLVLITNTGNLDTIYALDVSANPSLELALEVGELYIPPHMTAGVLLTARANQAGTYLITVTAASITSVAQGEETATLAVVADDELPATITGTVYNDANGNQTLDLGEAGLGGVSVSLDQAITATTNLSGAYALSTTWPGRHTLIQTDLPLYTSTTSNSVVITVALGGSYQVNFGDQLIEPAIACLGDAHEQDDSPAAAHSLGPGVTAALNFCDDAADWLSFTAQANQVYTITTLAWDLRTDTILTLYNTDGSTELAANDNYAGAPNSSSRIAWQAAASGVYFVRVSNRDDLAGSHTDYSVRIDTTAGPSISRLYLPLMLKAADSFAAVP